MDFRYGSSLRGRLAGRLRDAAPRRDDRRRQPLHPRRRGRARVGDPRPDPATPGGRRGRTAALLRRRDAGDRPRPTSCSSATDAPGASHDRRPSHIVHEEQAVHRRLMRFGEHESLATPMWEERDTSVRAVAGAPRLAVGPAGAPRRRRRRRSSPRRACRTPAHRSSTSSSPSSTTRPPTGSSARCSTSASATRPARSCSCPSPARGAAARRAHQHPLPRRRRRRRPGLLRGGRADRARRGGGAPSRRRRAAAHPRPADPRLVAGRPAVQRPGLRPARRDGGSASSSTRPTSATCSAGCAAWRACADDSGVGDLSWERLAWWQELTAQFFDAPRFRRYLPNLSRLPDPATRSRRTARHDEDARVAARRRVADGRGAPVRRLDRDPPRLAAASHARAAGRTAAFRLRLEGRHEMVELARRAGGDVRGAPGRPRPASGSARWARPARPSSSSIATATTRSLPRTPTA